MRFEFDLQVHGRHELQNLGDEREMETIEIAMLCLLLCNIAKFTFLVFDEECKDAFLRESD